MMHQRLSIAIDFMRLTVVLLFWVQDGIVRAQSIEEILSKCRGSVEGLFTYEYAAVSTNEVGEERRFFFARNGDAYRYDESGDDEFKAGFDGLYYYEFNSNHQIEKICSASSRMSGVIEPFQTCFGWLTRTNYRSELLKKPRWERFAKSCEGLGPKQQIDGHSCCVVTSGPEIEGHRYEVAFGENVGCLPVRVRRLVGNERKPVGELLMSEFKHFRIDGASFHFPIKFTLRSLVEGEQNMRVTELQTGSLYINRPIDSDLLRLQYNPIGFDR